MKPVIFSDKYFSITSFLSCVQYWLVEDWKSTGLRHPSLVPKLDLQCASLKERTIEVNTNMTYILLNAKMLTIVDLHCDNFLDSASKS